MAFQVIARIVISTEAAHGFVSGAPEKSASPLTRDFVTSSHLTSLLTR
ncbi:MAG TPA: hypothetical protein VGG81_07550 [Edaphobacter sp.]